MASITVIGGTGYAGAAIVAEAARRGHTVTAVSRSTPAEPVEGARYVEGSALDADVLATALEGASAVVVATAARGNMVDKQAALTASVAQAADAAGIRLVAIGGFSTLRPAPGAPRFIEGDVPEEYLVEATAGYAFLQLLQGSPESLDYVYVSPAGHFAAFNPVEPKGAYTLGDDVAIFDADGKSELSDADLALAVVDLIESGDKSREHVSVVG